VPWALLLGQGVHSPTPTVIVAAREARLRLARVSCVRTRVPIACTPRWPEGPALCASLAGSLGTAVPPSLGRRDAYGQSAAGRAGKRDTCRWAGARMTPVAFESAEVKLDEIFCGLPERPSTRVPRSRPARRAARARLWPMPHRCHSPRRPSGLEYVGIGKSAAISRGDRLGWFS